MAENNLPPGFVCSININKNPEKTPGNETYESGKTKPDFVLTTRYEGTEISIKFSFFQSSLIFCYFPFYIYNIIFLSNLRKIQ